MGICCWKVFDHFGMHLLPAQVGVGHEAAGQNRVDGDAVRGPVGGGGAGELHDGRFARLVMPPGDLAAGDQRVDRGDVDDPAAFAARLSIAPPISFVQTNVLVRFRSISSRQTSSGISSVAMFCRRPPALLIKMSIGANSDSARWHAASHLRGVLTSA